MQNIRNKGNIWWFGSPVLSCWPNGGKKKREFRRTKRNRTDRRWTQRWGNIFGSKVAAVLMWVSRCSFPTPKKNSDFSSPLLDPHRVPPCPVNYSTIFAVKFIFHKNLFQRSVSPVRGSDTSDEDRSPKSKAKPKREETAEVVIPGAMTKNPFSKYKSKNPVWFRWGGATNFQSAKQFHPLALFALRLKIRSAAELKYFCQKCTRFRFALGEQLMSSIQWRYALSPCQCTAWSNGSSKFVSFLRCVYCPGGAYSEQTVREHCGWWKHRDEAEKICPICLATYQKRSSMTSHMRQK